jgi:hypothetical protein
MSIFIGLKIRMGKIRVTTATTTIFKEKLNIR